MIKPVVATCENCMLERLGSRFNADGRIYTHLCGACKFKVSMTPERVAAFTAEMQATIGMLLKESA